jgi:acyl-coenzyme A thioesterase 9
VKADSKTIRYGKLFELFDALASDVVFRHFGDGVKEAVLVTASVDGLRALSEIDISSDLKLQGYLSYVGTSSMEVFFMSIFL